QPVVKQFLSGDRFGPIGMSEEKDEAVQKQEEAMQAAGIGGGGTKDDFSEIIPQVQPNPGMPERKAVARHRERVLELLPSLPENAQRAIRESMEQEDEIRAQAQAHGADMAENGAGAPAHAGGSGQGEWSSAGGVATAEAPTDVYEFAGNDAPTQQWDVPPAAQANQPTEQIDTTKKPRHGDGRS
ncbi:ABC transporter ATP-binding protein, partial [Gordonia sp. i37]